MNQNILWSYLKMDSFDVSISFSMPQKKIVNFLQEKNIPLDIPTEMQIVVKSKMLSLNVDFFIAFLFNGENLIAITMSPDLPLEGGALHSRYNEIQMALEKELGHPRNGLWSIMNLLDPDSRLARWQCKGIKIEHYLLNRFGMEEIINIKL